MNEPKTTNKIKSFNQRLHEIVITNLSNESFGIKELASELGLSRSHLYLKIRHKFNKSASQYIKDIRLDEAKKLLLGKDFTAAEISFLVGFSSPSYFNRCFHEKFGCTPGVFRQIKSNNTALESFQHGLISKNNVKAYNVFLPKGYKDFQYFIAKNQKLLFVLLLLIITGICIPFIKRYSYQGTIGKDEKTIAVLPFKNLSNNNSDQHLADGVMEAILNHLQRIGDLSVRSWTSTEQYRNSPLKIGEIGKELNVHYILEGSFQKLGNQANLVVKLISTKTDETLWTETYNKNWSEIFIVQSEVAKMIADELYLNLTSDIEAGLDVVPTINMNAYDFYLQGKMAYRTFEDSANFTKIHESIGYYNKAINIDDEFSLAYTGLGRAYWSLSIFESENINNDFIENSKNCLRKAIEFDKYNGWAFAELGAVQSFWERDSISARKNFDIALKLIPNDIYAYKNYLEHEYKLGNCKKLKDILNKLKIIDPSKTQPILEYEIKLLKCQKKYSEIIPISENCIGENFSIDGLFNIIDTYIYTGNFEKADQVIDFLKKKIKYKTSYYVFSGILNAKRGDHATALAMIDSLHKNSTMEYVYKTDFASVYAALGNKEKMYEYLDIAVSEKEYLLNYLPHFCTYIPYMEEDRLQEIIRKSWTPIN